MNPKKIFLNVPAPMYLSISNILLLICYVSFKKTLNVMLLALYHITFGKMNKINRIFLCIMRISI